MKAWILSLLFLCSLGALDTAYAQVGPLPCGAVSSLTTWRNDYPYSIGQVVILNGVTYQSLSNGNQDQNPCTYSGSQWTNVIGQSSGGVTSVSVGNLAPLFTSGVANPTSTPAVTYTLSNAAQNTILAGPASGGAGPYSFQTAPSFNGSNITNLPFQSLSTNGSGAATLISGVLNVPTPSIPSIPGLASYSARGLAPLGIAYVDSTSASGSADAFAAINLAYTQLPSGGGIIDARGLGSATYTVTTQMTALNGSKVVTLLLSPQTIFIINVNFATPTDSPSFAAIPIGEGSAIVVQGKQSSSLPDFNVGASAKIWDLISNGNFGGTQESLYLEGVNLAGNPSATVDGALLHLQGIFVGTRVTNSSTYECYAQCVELDAGNGSPGVASSDLMFDGDDFQDGAASGTYPGSVLRIDALTSSGGIGNMFFVGGAIQYNGPHNPLIVINGRGGSQTSTIEFMGVDFETSVAATSGANPNVDPIQLTDVQQVFFSNLHVTGATNPTYQINLVDISQTISGNAFGIQLNQLEVPTADGFTCLVNNTVDSTCEPGFATGHGDLTMPPYYFGGLINPQVRNTNIAPPSGTCVNGSIWTNSTGTTSSNTTYRCIAGSYVAF